MKHSAYITNDTDKHPVRTRKNGKNPRNNTFYFLPFYALKTTMKAHMTPVVCYAPGIRRMASWKERAPKIDGSWSCGVHARRRAWARLTRRQPPHARARALPGTNAGRRAYTFASAFARPRHAGLETCTAGWEACVTTSDVQVSEQDLLRAFSA